MIVNKLQMSPSLSLPPFMPSTRLLQDCCASKNLLVLYSRTTYISPDHRRYASSIQHHHHHPQPPNFFPFPPNISHRSSSGLLTRFRSFSILTRCLRSSSACKARCRAACCCLARTRLMSGERTAIRFGSVACLYD